MARSKRSNDVYSFHARAVVAAKKGITMKEFAKQERTLTNNVQARLYEAVCVGLPTVPFKEPNRGSRRRRKESDNVTPITWYTGRAKVPYLTLKVPTEIVQKAGKKGDIIEWNYSRGRIVGKRLLPPKPQADDNEKAEK